MESRTYLEPIILEKIRNIPEVFLPDLINIIDIFKNLSVQNHTINNSENVRMNIMDYAGIWSNVEDVDLFIEEIYKRRSSFNSKRVEI